VIIYIFKARLARTTN